MSEIMAMSGNGVLCVDFFGRGYYLLASERTMERTRMIENATTMNWRVFVRLAASRFSVCLFGLFLGFLVAIPTHLPDVWKRHRSSPSPVLPTLQVSKYMYRRRAAMLYRLSCPRLPTRT